MPGAKKSDLVTVQLWALQDAVARLPPPAHAGERRKAPVDRGDRELWKQDTVPRPSFAMVEFVAVEYMQNGRRWLAWELPVSAA